MSKKKRALQKIRAFIRQAKRRRLTRKATLTFTSFVIAWLPNNFGAQGAYFEWDNGCRVQVTKTSWKEFTGCVFVHSKIPVIVTNKGEVYKPSVGNKPDQRIYFPSR